MKKITLLLLLFAGLNGWFPRSSSAQEILTLEKALEIAYRNSPSLRTSKISLEQSEANLIQRKAGLKSQFAMSLSPFSYNRNSQYDEYNSTWFTSRTMNAGGNFSITQPIKWTDGTVTLTESFNWQDASNQSSGGSNTSFSNRLTLSLSQPIFTYNRTKIELQKLEYTLENSKLSYAMSQLAVERSVTQSFYGLYQSYKQWTNAQEEYQREKETYELTKAKVENGIMPKSELFQAELNLAKSESSLYDQETSYENTKDNFKKVLGIPLDEDIAVLPNTAVDSVHIDLNQAIKYALEQRIELKQKEISIAEGLFSLIEAKATNEFKGSISAEAGLFSNDSKFKNAFQRPEDNQNIRINLTIPIYDWGVRKASIKNAELANESQEIDFEEDKKGIIIDIRQILRNLPKLYYQITLAKQNVKNAEMTYDIYYEKYLNGNLSGMELKQYQSQLSSAKQAVTDAIIAYKLELLNLKIQTLWDFQTNKSYLPVNLLK